MATNLLNILGEVRGTGAVGEAPTDGIYWEIAIEPYGMDAGMYGHIVSMHADVNVKATTAQKDMWKVQADLLTSMSFTNEPYGVLVKIWESNEDGTFSSRNSVPAHYSGRHWAHVTTNGQPAFGQVLLDPDGNTGTISNDKFNSDISEGNYPNSDPANPSYIIYYIVSNTTTSTITGTSVAFTAGDELAWTGTAWIRRVTTSSGGGSGDGDMLTMVYDVNGNGIVDNSEKVNNLTVDTAVPSDAVFTDTVYTHPSTPGNSHIPSGGSVGQVIKNTADGKGTWQDESTGGGDGGQVDSIVAGTNVTIDSTDPVNPIVNATDTNTTYSVQDGELSEINFTTADNAKLDGIEADAEVNTVTPDNTISLTGKRMDDPSNFIHADAVHFKVKANEPLTTGDTLMYDGYNSGQNAIEVVKYDGTDIAIAICHYEAVAQGDFTTVLSLGFIEGNDGDAGDLDTSAYNEGDHLYPDASDGTWTNVKPLVMAQRAAIVLRSHVSNGALLVSFQSPMYDDSTTTKQGNTFNGLSQLVRTEADGKLPAIDGSLLTNLPGGFADPMTTRGDVIIRDAGNTTTRLPIGADTYVLTSDGTDVAWAAGGGAAMTDGEVKVAYENNADTNAFTDNEQTKLAGLDTEVLVSGEAAGEVKEVPLTLRVVTSTYTTFPNEALTLDGVFTVTMPLSHVSLDKITVYARSGSGTITLDGNGSLFIHQGATDPEFTVNVTNTETIFISNGTDWEVVI